MASPDFDTWDLKALAEECRKIKTRDGSAADATRKEAARLYNEYLDLILLMERADILEERRLKLRKQLARFVSVNKDLKENK